MKIIGDIQGSKILLLQGPMGTFFRKLDQYFTRHGAVTYKICFNAGDRLFALRKNRVDYRGNSQQWRGYITTFLQDQGIRKIFLFGNCRFYHKEAIQVAKELGIEVYVFEEGYIRPNYITLEKNGVNGDSAISHDPEFYADLNADNTAEELPARNNYRAMAFQATFYYLAAFFFQPFYPHYQHHRELSPLKEAFYGIRNLLRKIKYRVKERSCASLLGNQLKYKYYFVPLQTRIDFQIKEYSRYQDIETFIKEVIYSFSRNAPASTSLVIKHHPMERGMATYDNYIEKLAQQYDVRKRVISVHDACLPTCLANAIGTITINSTVGLSSLFHNTPTITLGTAVYDMEGLTAHGVTLDEFWTKYKKPDRLLFRKFRSHVISKTQLNSGFYGIFPNF
ncbi:MAG: capsular biosynthesis protein [Desulforhopalus sp.]